MNKNKSSRFINPYTFVPIADDEPVRGSVQRGGKSGVIDCKLTVVSPVFIPNTSSSKAFTLDSGAEKEHKSYEFYSYDDLKGGLSVGEPKNPIIPGSELRGMIRNIYEQLTNSCFLVTDEKNLPYKRTPEPKTPAVLKWDNGSNLWLLYKIPAPIKVPKKNTPNTQGAKVDADGRANSSGQYILHVTGDAIPPKEGELHRLIFDDDAYVSGGIPVNDDVIERLNNVVKSYSEKKGVNKKGNWGVYDAYRERLKNKESVVVYADKTDTYLSPSCMTKEYFIRKIPDILESQGGHHRCGSKDNACPACRLFGMIGKGGDGAIAGRVKFTDADLNSAQPLKWFDPMPLPILGTPHISATEFYLQPYFVNGKRVPTWNYDYWMRYAKDEKGNIEYLPTPYDPMLAGRKVYWHGAFSGAFKSYRLKTYNRMNCTVRPLSKGTFQFKVYFEDLTTGELDDLIFALNLADKGLHKIGKGKPIGMGDVKVTIDRVQYRKHTIDGEDLRVGYELAADANRYLDDDRTKLILTYTQDLSEDKKALVQYPTTSESDDIYKWFGKNRGRSVQRPTIQQILPKIDADVISLPKNP